MLHSFRKLLQHRVLVHSLVTRELKARYRGSVLGFFWSFVHPLLLLAVYTIVFRYIFRPQQEGTETVPFALYLFCGLLPWTWFSSALSEAANSLITGGNLIKKLLFPAEVLPIVSVLSNGVNFLLGLPVYLVFWIWFKPEGVSLHVLWLPLVAAVQLLFCAGLGLFLAALSVHFRDVRDLLANVLTLWFFASPIIYAPGFVQHPILGVALELNPMTHIIEGYHSAIFSGTLVHWKRLGTTGIVAVLVFVAGYFFFDRLRDSFPEEV